MTHGPWLIQIISQLEAVLHFDFPPRVRWLLELLQPLAIGLQLVLQIKCLSDLIFYQVWLVRTLGVPATLAALLLLWHA